MASTQELLLGEGAGGAAPTYIEDVFSTYLWTGTGATNTITNNIDLSTKGGLVWVKSRSSGTGYQNWTDTVRGASKDIFSNAIDAQGTSAQGVNAFSTTGFTVGTQVDYNGSGASMASWTFRKQTKFFDIVTYTGDGSNPRNISHNLGSVPGCIIVKKTSGTGDWAVYHRSLGNDNNVWLNSTAAQNIGSSYWGNTTPTSTVFTVGSSIVNASGANYVAYIFAHNAGGFGLTGTDNVISCGTYTVTGGSGPQVDLGFEPQFLLLKKSNAVGDWTIWDNMRGFSQTNGATLSPNLSSAESTYNTGMRPNATGFYDPGLYSIGNTIIYVAIRRGPMKVPTDATKVFSPQTSYSAQTINGVTYAVVTPNFPVDTYFWGKPAVTENKFLTARLLGQSDGLTNTTDSFSNNLASYWDSNTKTGQSASTIDTQIYECLQRAPSFHDVVCYTGTGSATTVTHNLGVTPELIIVKSRSAAATGWQTYHSALGATKGVQVQAINAASTSSAYWNNTSPTSSVFTVGTSSNTNAASTTYIAYLFATCTGVSKVGNYTGTGATQTINCGFTGGARYVLIKRTDASSPWYVWDTARGMVAGTDPRLPLNATTAATNTNFVYTITTGFQIVTSDGDVNANGGAYIYLAIA